MFSRKQRIILIAAGSVAVLLLIGLIALIRSEQHAAELHSTPSPSAIPLPTARITLRPTDIPTPEPTPEPTPTPIYQLPLVPFTDEMPIDEQPDAGPNDFPDPSDPLPSDLPAPLDPAVALPNSGAAVPVLEQFTPTAPIPMRFDSAVRDFLLVGTQSGAPTALLLARLAPPNLWIVSIPCEALSCTSAAEIRSMPLRKGKTVQAEAVLDELLQRFGLSQLHSITIELSCLCDMLSVLPPVSYGEVQLNGAYAKAVMQQSGTARAYGIGTLGAGLAELFSEISPWELPKLRPITKGKIETELNLFDLLGLASALRKVMDRSLVLLPTTGQGEELAFCLEDDVGLLKKTFR